MGDGEEEDEDVECIFFFFFENEGVLVVMMKAKLHILYIHSKIFFFICWMRSVVEQATNLKW